MIKRIPLLLVGKEARKTDMERIHIFESLLHSGLYFERFGPVLDEADILDTVNKITASSPALLFIDALQGGSARAMVLAAIKARVPVAIWCHDDKHSLASSSIASGALNQLNHPYVLIHGEPEQVGREFETALRAAAAVKRLKNARIGQLGPLHYNLVNAQINPLSITSRFGSWVVPISIAALKKQVTDISEDEIEKKLDELKEKHIVEAGDDLLKRALALRLALRNIALKNRLDAVAADCWNEIVPDIGINPCLEFVYNEYTIACEGDLTLALTMLAGEEICDMPGYCGDLYSLDESNGIASLMHCTGCSKLHGGEGPMKITVQQSPNTIVPGRELAVLQPELAPGPGVILILHGMSMENLHLRKCKIIRTDFTNQMRLIIKIEGDNSNFRKEAAGNHYTVFPGECYEAWKLWARWNGVNIH